MFRLGKTAIGGPLDSMRVLSLHTNVPKRIIHLASTPKVGLTPSIKEPHFTQFLRYAHKGSYKSPDSQIDTDEIISENNPWSPSILNDVVKVRKPGKARAVELPENFRLAYQPIYEAPGSKYVSLLKRLTISVGVLGCYGAKLFYDSPNFDDFYAVFTLTSSWVPAALVQYKTRHYVTRIFRLYDKEKPQTLENLVNDENLIIEKLNVTGGKTYNSLIRITQNPSLKIVPPARSSLLTPYATWEDIEPDSKVKRYHYIVDDIGGMKMDRLWGIAERNSNIDNGRYINPTDYSSPN